MNNIYFTSDTHYHHKNIVRGTSEWEESQMANQRTRDFDTLEEHDDTLVNNINSLVKENDVLWHLGDWAFGGHPKILEFSKRLNCRNIHLIFGNHDQHIEPVNSIYRPCFSSVQHYKELSFKIDSMKSGIYGKTKICLFHYGMRVWCQSHHQSILLYGHSHGTLPGIGRSMDVGVDTNNLYPYHLDEIIDRMRNLRNGVVDHHNELTN